MTPAACGLPQVHEEMGRFPLIIRPAFTLGGTGGGIAYNMEEYLDIVGQGLAASMTDQASSCAQQYWGPTQNWNCKAASRTERFTIVSQRRQADCPLGRKAPTWAWAPLRKDAGRRA